MAVIAASFISSGPSKFGNPWARFTASYLLAAWVIRLKIDVPKALHPFGISGMKPPNYKNDKLARCPYVYTPTEVSLAMPQILQI
jgi:hypothetical protein